MPGQVQYDNMKHACIIEWYIWLISFVLTHTFINSSVRIHNIYIIAYFSNLP